MAHGNNVQVDDSREQTGFLLYLIMMFYQKLISLANKLYKDAKPLEGKALEILNKTYKRLLSKTPTKL